MHDDRIEKAAEAGAEALKSLNEEQGHLLEEATSALPRDWDVPMRLKWIFTSHDDLGYAPLVAVANGNRSVIELARAEK
ncbi:hypothetical protein [Sulfitobacter dubius]|uniref:hypothetical protein n=1 Tax=Sulfitobacter dubius TaxID=218673 RepID=UPI0022AFC240|nr:hypothetical protein [Sulfitobacter dubius]MCZ4366658.1 hypothetical protein [Sulfitobacter dubius]